MHHIQVWQALPGKRRDDNRIVDIRLEQDADDCEAPVLATFERPGSGIRRLMRLRLCGLQNFRLLGHVAEIVRIVVADPIRLAASVTGTIHDGLTLTISYLDSDEPFEVARLTLTPECGRPFKYDAAWTNEIGEIVAAFTLEFSPHDLRPWELLRATVSVLQTLQWSPRLTRLQYPMVSDAEAEAGVAGK